MRLRFVVGRCLARVPLHRWITGASSRGERSSPFLRIRVSGGRRGAAAVGMVLLAAVSLGDGTGGMAAARADEIKKTGTIIGREHLAEDAPTTSAKTSRSEPVPSLDAKGSEKESALEHAAKHAQENYVCPMHPDVVSQNPDETCPICGMDLVLVEGGGDGGIVTITPVTMAALGVRTQPVSRRTIFRSIDTVGYVAEDENNVRAVSLRTDAWVEYMHVKYEGERVRAGQALVEIYAPQLVNAQEEYVQALNLGNPELIRASRERLRALGVSNYQVRKLTQSRAVQQHVTVFAPQNGIISELRVREGMHVKKSQEIMRLSDLDSVWLVVDVFERQADWVEVGQKARATLPYKPGKTWQGTVEYIYPTIDPKTRSLKVRLRFDNKSGELKPNMYADVKIFAKPRKKVLTVPREAVIKTGKEQRVIVALGDGKFVPMKVRTGVETDDRIEIVSGLKEGDNVVVSSQFMIDSEASVKAALMRMLGR